MRRFATAAIIAGAALASSAGSANAFFHLLFQSEQQTQAQQYYRNDPSSRVQISPVPREVVAFSGYSRRHDRGLDLRAPPLLRAR